MTNNAGKVTSCADGRTFQIAAVTKGFPKVSKLWPWEGDNIRSYVMVIFKYGIVCAKLRIKFKKNLIASLRFLSIHPQRKSC